MANFTGVGEMFGASHRLLTVLPMIAVYYYMAARLGKARARHALLGERQAAARDRQSLVSHRPSLGTAEEILARLYLYLAVILGTTLIRLELGHALTAIGWMAAMLALLAIGQRRDLPDLRLQAYALAMLVFVRTWATNFHLGGTIVGVDGRLLTGVVVIAGFFAAHLFQRRQRSALRAGRAATPGARADGEPGGRYATLITWVDAHGASLMSLLGTVLLAALLFYEVSGSLLTIAWGLQGTALLLAGFVLRERQLRLSGLVLLGVCILKAFFYDFRQLEIVFRIFSFIVLGSLLLAVSFVYSRYREQLKRLL